jgi:hypothetical protein
MAIRKSLNLAVVVVLDDDGTEPIGLKYSLAIFDTRDANLLFDEVGDYAGFFTRRSFRVSYGILWH